MEPCCPLCYDEVLRRRRWRLMSILPEFRKGGLSMSMTDTTFDDLLSQAQTQGVDAALESLAQRMRAEHKAHELFDLRLMQRGTR